MMSIFGYLCFLIIFKWFQNYAESGKEAPGLLNTLIFMFLQLGVVKPKDQLFEGQVCSKHENILPAKVKFFNATANSSTNSLVPFRDLCTLDVGYKAMVSLPRT